MGKFYGSIGFAKPTEETKPGIYEEPIIERKYYGEVIRQTRRLQSSDNLNDDLVVSNSISIIADPFAYDNYFSIRYVEFMGVKWKVSNVEVLHPRLNLTLGEMYNANLVGNDNYV